MRKAILATIIGIAMMSTVLPVASGPIQFGHVWGTLWDDDAKAVEIDSAGNVFLVGDYWDYDLQMYVGFVVKLDPAGNLLWDRSLSLPDVNLEVRDCSLGPSGSLYVLAQKGFGLGTYYAKISAAGDLVYFKEFSAMRSPTRMASDPSGGFVMVGDIGDFYDGVVASVTDDGSVRWSMTASSTDWATPWAVTVDLSGSIYAFCDRTGTSDVGLVRFDPTGSMIREIILPTETLFEYTWDLAVGHDGNIYALGANYDSGRLLLAAFTPQLDLLWDEYVGTPLAGYEATRLVVAADGSLYAVGFSTFTSDGTNGPAVFRFLTTGALVSAEYFGIGSTTVKFAMNDAVAYPGGGILAAGWTLGVPQTTPAVIEGVELSEIPESWVADTVAWSAMSYGGTSVECSFADPAAMVDNYNLDQGEQAWYGVIDSTLPFRVTITVRTGDSTSVEFRGHATGGHSPYTYSWSFGDGFVATSSRISHDFGVGGLYHVQLMVTDRNGRVSFASTDVMIPSPPIVTDVIQSPNPGRVGYPIQFNVFAYDPDGGDLVSYFWEFGDNSTAGTTEPYVTHTYTSSGYFALQVTATDDEGVSGAGGFTVNVRPAVNQYPDPNYSYSPVAPVNGQDIVFDASSSYDPDGYIVSYSWLFGDSSSANGSIVNHSYVLPGDYYVSLTVLDDMGAVSNIAGYITVYPSEPPGVILEEGFDSWSSLRPGWTFWNYSSPYNYVDVRNGVMYMSDYSGIPVNDSRDAYAQWSGYAGYPEALQVSYRIFLPLDHDEKYGIYGQFVIFNLYAPEDINLTTTPGIDTRFMMDTWTGSPNGWIELGRDGSAHKICDFEAGWHNVSVVMEKGATTWTAIFDGVPYPGQPFSPTHSEAFDVQRVLFSNGLREETVISEVDNLVVERTAFSSPPVAEFTYSVDGSTVFVDASPSTSGTGIASYSWNWGDGSPAQSSASPTAAHTYTTGGLTTSGVTIESGAATVSQSVDEPREAPPVPYNVVGYVTDSQANPMLNCPVFVTNKRTGDILNLTTDVDYGFYIVDLNILPNGLTPGDVIQVVADNGALYGVNEGIAFAPGNEAYLWLDVIVEPTGNATYYSVTLTVTDLLGMTASVVHVVPIQAAPVPPDQYEPDDDYLSATWLNMSSSQEHSIDNGGADVDWFAFTVPADTVSVLETSGLSGDTMLYLYNSYGVPTNPIATDDNSGPGDFSRIVINQTWAGTLYAKVTEAGMDAEIASYNIRLGPVSQAAQWTFMVYMDGDNNLEEVALVDFLELSSVGSSDAINIVVELDRSPFYSWDYGNWTDTKRFYVTPGMTPQASSAVADLGEQNMGSQETLLDFVTWAASNYPAENYMLVMWDHGGGWDGAVCFDETNEDAITLDELEFALSGNMNTTGQWIDSVGFDACLMGMVEVSYEIREWTDVMVASEESVPWDGWPYDTVMSDLSADPYMNASQLGAVVVQRYMEFYGTSGEETMSVLDISQAAGLYWAVNAFSYALAANLNSSGSQIMNAWSQTDWFSYDDYRDLWDFASTLAGYLPANALYYSAVNVTTAVSNAVIAEAHGALHSDARGMSIYFPAYNYITDYGLLDFAADTGWDEFIVAFSGGSGIADIYEPDDTYLEAATIQFGDIQTHSIDEGGADVDWVTFHLNQTTEFTISTSGPAGDTVMYLYDSYGVPNSAILYSDDYNGLWSMIHYTAPAGTYYVKVAEFGMNSNIPTYYLELEVGSGYNSPPVAMIHMSPSQPIVNEITMFDGSFSYDVDGYITSWYWYFDTGYSTTGPVAYASFPTAGYHNVQLNVYDDDGAYDYVTYGFDVIDELTPDIYEPDDNYSMATPISPGETQSHSISDGGFDVDWLTFTINQTWDVRAEAFVPNSNYGSVNVSLFSAATVTTGAIAICDWWNSSLVVPVQCVLRPGTYYLMITSSWGFYQIFEYTMTLTLKPVGPGDQYEPDDTILDASTIEMMTTQTHSILKNGADVDWIKFVLTTTTDVGIRTFGPLDQWTDTVILLYGAAGGLKELLQWNDDTSSNLWSMIKMQLHAGTYYVMVQAYDFADNIPVYQIELNYSYNMNEPPYAYFSFDPWNPSTYQEIIFNGNYSFDNDGYITDYSWDFGDGATGSGMVVSHAYSSEGTYNVSLIVTDDYGDQALFTNVVYVTENDPPYVNLTYYPSNPSLYQYVTFSGYAYDIDGYIDHFEWTIDNVSGYWTWYPQMDYYFTSPGEHIVTLTAIDNMGAEGSATVVVTINQPPVAVIDASPEIGKVGGVCTFDASGSYDPDGDSLTYSWDFGDGMNNTGPVVSHVFMSVGMHIVYLFVEDGHGGWNYTQLSYAVVEPVPPLAIAAYSPPRPSVGQTVTFDGFASFDPDGSIAVYIWQFGDGSVGNGQVATHVYQNSGTYSVKLTVMDEDNLVDDDTVFITVASVPTVGFVFAPTPPVAGSVETFFAYGSYDESGIVSYEWSLGDGFYVANSWLVSHTYTLPGTYTVTLTVTNSYGVRSSASQTIVVMSSGTQLVGSLGNANGYTGPSESSSGRILGLGTGALNDFASAPALVLIGLAGIAYVLGRPRTKN